MKFSLLVLSPPQADSSSHAYHFAKAIVKSEYHLYRVFFYQGGVLNAVRYADERYPVNLLWQQMALNDEVDLTVCSTAALKRGIFETERNSTNSEGTLELLPGFTLSGLGQLTDADVSCDRLITFG